MTSVEIYKMSGGAHPRFVFDPQGRGIILTEQQVEDLYAQLSYLVKV